MELIGARLASATTGGFSPRPGLSLHLALGLKRPRSGGFACGLSRGRHSVNLYFLRVSRAVRGEVFGTLICYEERRCSGV